MSWNKRIRCVVVKFGGKALSDGKLVRKAAVSGKEEIYR